MGQWLILKIGYDCQIPQEGGGRAYLANSLIIIWITDVWIFNMHRSQLNVSPYIDIVLLFLHFLVLCDYWVQASESRIPLTPMLMGFRDVAFSSSFMNRLKSNWVCCFSKFVGSLYFWRIPFSDYLKITTAVIVACGRAGMGRDFLPGYPSPYYPWVPGTHYVTIAFWACPQLENIHLNENNKQRQLVCRSLACSWEEYENAEMFVL